MVIILHIRILSAIYLIELISLKAKLTKHRDSKAQDQVPQQQQPQVVLQLFLEELEM